MKKEIICLFALLLMVFSLSSCTQPEDSSASVETVTTQVLCTDEVQECPDGSFVGRDTYNNCAFKECPQ